MNGINKSFSFFLAALLSASLFYSCSAPDNAGETAAIAEPSGAYDEAKTQRKNKELYREMIAAFNAGDIEKAATYFGDNYNMRGNDNVNDKASLKQLLNTYKTALQLQYEVKELMAEEDRVVYSMKVKGNHKGEYDGQQATNKDMAFPAVGIVRFENGKIVEEWELVDDLKVTPTVEVTPES